MKYLKLFEQYINESANLKTLQHLAESNNKADKDALFKMINDSEFKSSSPFKERLKITKFDNSSISKIQSLLFSNKKAAQLLFDMKTTGIGRGEIMLAYIVENLSIGGGSNNIDLTLYDDNGGVLDRAELKEGRLDSNGWLWNWKTAVNHRFIISKALDDLKNLYNSLASVLPELDVNTKFGKTIRDGVNKGEMSRFVTFARNLDPVKIYQELSFKIDKTPENDFVISTDDGKNLGSLKRKDTLSRIDQEISKDNQIIVKSIKDIESELAKSFNEINEKFVFLGTVKNSLEGIYYFDRIPGDTSKTQIMSVTQGTIKMKVKVK